MKELIEDTYGKYCLLKELEEEKELARRKELFNAIDFGDLGVAIHSHYPASRINVLDYVTILTTGNAGGESKEEK